MRVLITGAGGVLGKRTLARAVESGHEVSVLTHSADRQFPDVSKVHRADLATGEGLKPALDGVEAVIHCATDPSRHNEVDVVGTERLVAASDPDTHIVYPGIVGSDVIQLKYYRSKIRAEAALTERPWSVIRATQFHHLAWMMLERWSRYPMMVVPAGTRLQTLDPNTIAAQMVAALEHPGGGLLPDIGGPRAYEFSELAKSFLAARRKRRWVIPVNIPGLAAAGFRAGGNLTPNRDESGDTWNDFVGRRLSDVV